MVVRLSPVLSRTDLCAHCDAVTKRGEFFPPAEGLSAGEYPGQFSRLRVPLRHCPLGGSKISGNLSSLPWISCNHYGRRARWARASCGDNVCCTGVFLSRRVIIGCFCCTLFPIIRNVAPQWRSPWQKRSVSPHDFLSSVNLLVNGRCACVSSFAADVRI